MAASPPSKKTLSSDEMSKLKDSAWNMKMAHEIALLGNSKILKNSLFQDKPEGS